MSVPDHRQQSPRRSLSFGLRQALIRLLGGVPADETREPPSALATATDFRLLRLPPRDSEKMVHQAQDYFCYAEDLNLRGSPELAAAFYRQAYTLISASLEETALTSIHASGERLLSEPAFSRRTHPAFEGRDQGHQTITEESSPQDIVQPQEDNSTTRISDQELLNQLHNLRPRLNRENAASILNQLEELEQHGLQDSELYYLQGMANLLLQKNQDAEKNFRQALAVNDSHYESLVNLSGIQLTTRRPDEALELLHRALRLKSPDAPEAVPALTNLSLAHELAGRPMEAAQLVLQVHRLKPGHLRTVRIRKAAATLEEMGDDADAIELLSWVREHAPNQDDLRLLAELLERRGDFQEAALVYRQLLSDEPSTTPS